MATPQGNPSPFKLLRTSTALTDDADYAGTQVAPTSLVTLASVASPTGIELVVEWLDVGEAIVNGAGEYTLNVIKVVDRPGGASSIVIDSLPIECQGSRSIVVDNLRVGDSIGVRLTDITAPGASTHFRVLYREDAR